MKKNSYMNKQYIMQLLRESIYSIRSRCANNVLVLKIKPCQDYNHSNYGMDKNGMLLN